MELFCIEVTVSNSNFEVLSRNFSFIPGYTFFEFLQLERDPHLKLESQPQKVNAKFRQKTRYVSRILDRLQCIRYSVANTTKKYSSVKCVY